MAVNQLLYTQNIRGSIATVGNTLGLFGRFNPNSSPDGIGAFVSTNTALVFGSYPPGSTANWTQNSSSNVLSLPTGSKLLKAYLFYGGNSINGVQNVSGSINGAVTFTRPSGSAVRITPDNVNTIVDDFTGNTSYHARRDITSLMEGSGTYTLGAVPGTLGDNLNIPGIENNYLGWTIVVTYEDDAVTVVRNLTTWDIFNRVLNNSPVDITITGFITAPLRSPKGKMFLGAGSGDNYIEGDRVVFGPNVAGLTILSGPNNASGNFFQSQINNDEGVLSTTGTFGTRNQPFAVTGVLGPIVGNRQGWDKTAVDASSGLRKNQTSALIRLFTTGDLYYPQYVAMQIDLDAPIITPTKAVSSTTAFVGTKLTYTISFTNVGNANADNIVITDPIPNGTSYVAGSITSNVAILGTPSTTISLINSVAPGQRVTISYQVQVNAIPIPNPIPNTATVNYTFTPANGLNPIAVVVNTNTVYTRVYADPSPRGIAFI